MPKKGAWQERGGDAFEGVDTAMHTMLFEPSSKEKYQLMKG